MNLILDPRRIEATRGREAAVAGRDRRQLHAPIGPDEIARLYAALDRVTSETNPRTARLLKAGRKQMAKKLIEEAGEVALEASCHQVPTTVQESADLLYHLVVLWRACGINPDQVWAEMRQRADRLGLAEKLPKKASSAKPRPLAVRDPP